MTRGFDSSQPTDHPALRVPFIGSTDPALRYRFSRQFATPRYKSVADSEIVAVLYEPLELEAASVQRHHDRRTRSRYEMDSSPTSNKSRNAAAQTAFEPITDEPS